MFCVGDKIVHPMHGAGVVEDIVENKINGVLREYYVLKLPARAMVVMIPTGNCKEIGVRPIICREAAESVLARLPELRTDIEQNWNRRYRENMDRIKSGDLIEVAHVIKSLMERDRERGLSTGERKMLHSAKDILLSELVMSLGSSYEELESKIDRMLA